MIEILAWERGAWSDYLDWQEQDKKALPRINKLLNDVLRQPFLGIGKPERLRGTPRDLWSRRIDKCNRLVYEADDTQLTIISCRGHYD